MIYLDDLFMLTSSEMHAFRFWIEKDEDVLIHKLNQALSYPL